MGHTNSTPNLHLPQFVGSDKPTWLSDVNGAMLAIDTAYGTIEAEASSAATAAAGAVTVAGAAQTAADSAASAAATAGTNASQALSTANNAATVALQAQSDAADALEVATGKLLATVTADGVKTVSALMDELRALINPSELTVNAALVLGDNTFICRYHGTDSNGVISFEHSAAGSSYLYVTRVRLAASGSTWGDAQITSSGFNYADSTSNTPSSGTKYSVYA